MWNVPTNVDRKANGGARKNINSIARLFRLSPSSSFSRTTVTKLVLIVLLTFWFQNLLLLHHRQSSTANSSSTTTSTMQQLMLSSSNVTTALNNKKKKKQNVGMQRQRGATFIRRATNGTNLLFVHIGKCGGETIKGISRIGCEVRNSARNRNACFDDFYNRTNVTLGRLPETALSKSIHGYFHYRRLSPSEYVG